jgi:hypothetical protein
MARSAVAEQHLDAIRRGTVDVVLDEVQSRPHLQQVEQCDRLLRGLGPLGNRRGSVDVDQPIGDEQPDCGVGDRLGHAPRDERRLRVDLDRPLELVRRLNTVPLGQDVPALQDDEASDRPSAGGRPNRASMCAVRDESLIGEGR